MIEEKLSRLIDVLTKKTREEKLVWKGTASPNIYLANFEEFGITIRSNTPGIVLIPTSSAYTLSLLNQNGEEIESKTAVHSTESDYDALQDLYRLARRSAHNVEESLNNLLKKLEA